MYYFAYSSDLSLKNMSALCPGAKPLFTVVLPNYRIIFTGWVRQWRGGTATIRGCRDEKVLGAVYEISNRDLQIMDRHMGYPAVYDRLNLFVITRDGDSVEAVTYIKREPMEVTKPSREYLDAIRQGYKDWRIAYEKGA